MSVSNDNINLLHISQSDKAFIHNNSLSVNQAIVTDPSHKNMEEIEQLNVIKSTTISQKNTKVCNQLEMYGSHSGQLISQVFYISQSFCQLHVV